MRVRGLNWTRCETEYLSNVYHDLSLSVEEMAKHLNRPVKGVHAKISNLGLGKSMVQKNGNKYTLRGEALNDEEFMSYMCGLWASDGSLDSRDSRITHVFHQDDEEHMHKVYSFLVNEPVEFRHRKSKQGLFIHREFRHTFKELESIWRMLD